MATAVYFVNRGPANSGPYTLHQLRHLWSAGELTVDSQYRTQPDGAWQPLGTMTEQLETGLVEPAVPTNDLFIAQIRAGTSYATLRRLVDWISNLALLCSFLFPATYFLARILTDESGSGWIMVMHLIVAAVWLAVAATLSVAFRQAALLLIDVADMLITAGRHYRPAPRV